MVTASKDGTWRVWNIDVRYRQQEDAKCLLQHQQEVSSHPNTDHGCNMTASCTAYCATAHEDVISMHHTLLRMITWFQVTQSDGVSANGCLFSTPL